MQRKPKEVKPQTKPRSNISSQPKQNAASKVSKSTIAEEKHHERALTNNRVKDDLRNYQKSGDTKGEEDNIQMIWRLLQETANDIIACQDLQGLYFYGLYVCSMKARRDDM